MEIITFGVLTISDRCAANESEDESGPNLVRLISSGLIPSSEVTVTGLVPDNFVEIQKKLKEWSDELCVNVILTSGGTGLSKSDITPEATAPLLDREFPGISNLIFKHCSKITPLTCLSRGVCGVRNKTLIINFPGSKRASQQCLEAVAGIVRHAVDLIRDNKPNVRSFHGEPQREVGRSKVDSTNIVKRDRISGYELLTVQEAQAMLKDTLTEEVNIEKVKTVHLDKCLGYVLAEDVVAKEPLPPFPTSVKDGYAVLANDFTDVKTVLDFSAAGDFKVGNADMKPGFCVRVNTGACVPAGADAVIQVEDTEVVATTEDGREELQVRFKRFAQPGEDIRKTGSDISVGEVVLKKSSYLGSSELGVLGAVGAVSVKVYDRPRAGILSTGNELQNPDEELRFGKIRDSNRITLRAFLQEHGFSSVDLGIARDHPDELFQSLKKGFEKVDIVITSGSVSMGDKDYLKQVLVTDFNAVIHFGRVLMKPGKPTCFATFKLNGKTKMWFGLPGNPASVVVTSNLFLLPALKIMSGHQDPFPPRINVRLAEDIALDERPEYRRAILKYASEGTSDIPLAYTTGRQMSSRLVSCVAVDCLLELPPSSDSLKKKPNGSTVNALLIRIP